MGKLFKGIGASSGIVIGKAYILSNPIFSLNENTVNDVNKEIENYHKSIEISIDQLNKIKEVALKKLGEEKADVFNAHIQLVDDPEIKSEIEKKINEAHINAA
jgi:phosphotransferase system enzyme I (PtsI)